MALFTYIFKDNLNLMYGLYQDVLYLHLLYYYLLYQEHQEKITE